MYCRSHTTPAVYYASKSIVGGLYVFTFAAPEMVYVQNECAVVCKFEAVFESPLVFVVFDCDSVSCFRRESFKCVDDALWTFSTRYVYIALEVLELLSVTHIADDIGVIFKFFYAPIYYIVVITSKHSKLTRMHRQPYIQPPCKFADPCEMLLTICDHSR